MPMPPLVEPVAALSDAERARTARHLVLRGFGEVGQRRLAAAHIAIVGAGGLGSPTVLALAAAGVGTLTVIDDDIVEATNLQRQVMHRRADVGRPKVDSAVRVAADLAPETVVHPVGVRLTSANAAEMLSDADLVLDGSDSFATREIVAAACEELGKPLVWGTIQEFGGQVTVFWSAPPEGCAPVRLRDLYPPESTGDVPSCSAVGVLGAICLQVGALMATEAIKLVTGIGEPLLGRVLVIDALRATQREVPLGPSRQAVSDAAPALPATIAACDLDPAMTLIDVRETDEVAAGAIPGARHLPLTELLADPAALAACDNPVIVCEVGARATTAARALAEAGVAASVLDGGMRAWRATAHTTETHTTVTA